VRFCTSRLIVRAVAFLSLLAPVLCAAAELTVNPPVNPTQRYLNEKLSLWQKRLKLEDWSVTVIASQPDGLRTGTLGNIRWDPEKKTAVIKVLDSSGYQTSSEATLRDMEFTVVHELIHLEFCASTRADTRADEETAVNHIAEALLQLDRGN
jgi:hypothetical protein